MVANNEGSLLQAIEDQPRLPDDVLYRIAQHLRATELTPSSTVRPGLARFLDLVASASDAARDRAARLMGYVTALDVVLQRELDNTQRYADLPHLLVALRLVRFVGGAGADGARYWPYTAGLSQLVTRPADVCVSFQLPPDPDAGFAMHTQVSPSILPPVAALCCHNVSAHHLDLVLGIQPAPLVVIAYAPDPAPARHALGGS
ncbi:hypothetical protein Q5752_005764 [Cryptotrichosporon argae]